MKYWEVKPREFQLMPNIKRATFKENLSSQLHLWFDEFYLSSRAIFQMPMLVKLIKERFTRKSTAQIREKFFRRLKLCCSQVTLPLVSFPDPLAIESELKNLSTLPLAVINNKKIMVMMIIISLVSSFRWWGWGFRLPKVWRWSRIVCWVCQDRFNITKVFSTPAVCC